MISNCTFYLCPVCFEVSETPREHHSRQMVWCDAGQPGDEARKPLIDSQGHLKSHAPRWFLEAVGALPARSLPRPLFSNL